MSLPSSERLPNNINDLPPARQRHIRRQPRSASLAERQILLESLLTLIAPTPNFFILSLLGALAAGAALYIDEPAILIVAIVTFPFLRPIFGLSLFPVTLKFGHVLKSIVSLLILFVLSLSAGVLAGWLRGSILVETVSILRFSNLYWLDLTVLGGSSVLGAFILIRQGRLPRLIGVVLSYMMLIPLTVAGFGLALNQTALWQGALLVFVVHLGVSIVLTMLTFLMIGFTPKNSMGWLLLIVTLALTLAFLTGSLNLSTHQLPSTIQPSPTMISLATPSLTPSPKTVITSTRTKISATNTLTPTQSPTITRTPTQTPTPEPTTYWVIVNATSGAVIRESSSFDSPVIGYVNDGDLIEIFGEDVSQSGSRWYQVQVPTGETGWILGSLVNTQTPTPTED